MSSIYSEAYPEFEVVDIQFAYNVSDLIKMDKARWVGEFNPVKRINEPVNVLTGNLPYKPETTASARQWVAIGWKCGHTCAETSVCVAIRADVAAR